MLAAREDAELEGLDADDAGHLLLLVWNTAGGRSEVELYDTRTDERRPVPGLPGQVVSGALLSRDGSRVVAGRRGSGSAAGGVDDGGLDLRLDTGHCRRRSAAGRAGRPELVRFPARDGLELTGWLYRVPDRTEPGPAMLSLHGGPEAQERPGFSPQHQAMVAAGIAVFAPNIRGSSGFGRAFVRADDVHGRRDAFDDVIVCCAVPDLGRDRRSAPDRGDREIVRRLSDARRRWRSRRASSPPAWTSAGCRTC